MNPTFALLRELLFKPPGEPVRVRLPRSPLQAYARSASGLPLPYRPRRGYDGKEHMRESAVQDEFLFELEPAFFEFMD